MPIVNGNGGSSPVVVASRSLSASELGTLNAVGVELVAAPGSGKMLVPVAAWGIFTPGSAAYTPAIGNQLAIGAGTAPGTPDEPWLYFNKVHDVFSQTLGNPTVFGFGFPGDPTCVWDGTGWDLVSVFDDKALVVQVTSGLGPGDGTCKLSVSYIVADLT